MVGGDFSFRLYDGALTPAMAPSHPVSGAPAGGRRLRPPIARAKAPPGSAGRVKPGAAAEPREGILDAPEPSSPAPSGRRWDDHRPSRSLARPAHQLDGHQPARAEDRQPARLSTTTRSTDSVDGEVKWRS